jgi:hypothetical protein
VHVTHVEAGALAVQAARAEGREPALVRELAQGVALVDDLRQLAAPEEVLDRRADRLAVDQLARRGGLDRLLVVHALGRGAPQLEQALAELVARELGDRAHAPVPEVVDVVELPLARAQLHDVADAVHDVLGQQRHVAVALLLAAELAVDAEAPHRPEAVARRVLEALAEERARLLDVRRVAGPEPRVDLEQRLLVAARVVLGERVEDHRVVLGVLDDVDGLQRAAEQRLEGLGRDHRAAREQDLAGARVDDVGPRRACRAAPCRGCPSGRPSWSCRRAG